MKEVIFLSGLPCSGKTTWAKQFIKENDNWIRINRDDLRNMKGKYWVPSHEKLITEWENQIAISALQNGNNVLIDATNLSPSRNYNKIKEFEINGDLRNEIYHRTVEFPIYPEDAIERDIKRENPVGKEVIIRMYKKYMAPERDYDKPPAVIFDIDGTLSFMKNRHAYEWDKVDNDEVNVPMRDLYTSCLTKGYKTILVSGRDSVCFKKTKKWLEDNGFILPHELLMKRRRSTEKSYRFKHQTYTNYIVNNYNVKFAVDDRESDINTWRSMGLKTLQPNFE